MEQDLEGLEKKERTNYGLGEKDLEKKDHLRDKIG